MRVRPMVTCLALLPLSACMEQGFTSWPPRFLPVDTAPEIRIEPQQHDFGAPPVGCPLAQPFEVHNDGDADLVVSKIRFQGASEELALVDGNVLPLRIPPGESAPLEVTYLGHDAADDYGSIVVSSDDPDEPRATADVRGRAVSAPLVDVFEQPVQAKTDVLVVIDNSGSMDFEQQQLTTNFQLFVDALVQAHADFHVAVVPTDASAFVGPVVTLTSTDPVRTFNDQALSVGVDGSGDERPMDMVHEATSPGGDAAPGGTFLRDDAMLAVIVVTDEPDEYSVVTVDALVDHLVALKAGDASQVRVHTIGGDVPVPACETASYASVPLDELVAATGGLFESVCGNWGATLTNVAASSVALADRFPLSDEPWLPSVTITVDGVEVTTGWSYDAASGAIVFDLASIPPSEAVVEITYEPLPDCEIE